MLLNLICFLSFINNFGLNCKNNFSFYIYFCMAWDIRSTITWIRFYCFLECPSVPETKSVTTLMKHSITYWSQIKMTLGSLKVTTTVIVVLIPNAMMMIALFQLQLTFPSLELTRIPSEWNLWYRKRDQNVKESLVL